MEIGFVTEELIREISEGGELDDVTTDKILNIFKNHIATYYTLNGSSEIGDYSAQHEDEVQERIDAALVGMAPESDLQHRIHVAIQGMVSEDVVQERIDKSMPWDPGESRELSHRLKVDCDPVGPVNRFTDNLGCGKCELIEGTLIWPSWVDSEVPLRPSFSDSCVINDEGQGHCAFGTRRCWVE